MTAHRRAIKILLVLAAVLRRRKLEVRSSGPMDEAGVNACGESKYLCGTVDRDGDTIDFLLRAERDHAAAQRFLERAIDLQGVPRKFTSGESGACTAAIECIRADSGADIELRRINRLNNIVALDHRTIMGFKLFRCA